MAGADATNPFTRLRQEPLEWAGGVSNHTRRERPHVSCSVWAVSHPHTAGPVPKLPRTCAVCKGPPRVRHSVHPERRLWSGVGISAGIRECVRLIMAAVFKTSLYLDLTTRWAQDWAQRAFTYNF